MNEIYEPTFGQDFVLVSNEAIKQYWYIYAVCLIVILINLISSGLVSALVAGLWWVAGHLVGTTFGTVEVRRARQTQIALLREAYGDKARVFYTGRPLNTKV